MQVGPYKIPLQQVSRGVLVLFFVAAGINHFWHPDFYLPLIPDYFPYKELINVFSGLAEIFLGLGMWSKVSRKWASWGLVGLLIAFIPAHVYFIQIGSCVPKGLCTPAWLAWVRLVLIQPLFILWVGYHRK